MAYLKEKKEGEYQHVQINSESLSQISSKRNGQRTTLSQHVSTLMNFFCCLFFSPNNKNTNSETVFANDLQHLMLKRSAW